MKSQIETDLAVLAADVVAEAEPAGPDSPIRVVGPIPDRDATTRRDTVVLGSPIALHRAIAALVDNAVWHADHSVRVSVRRAHHHVVVEVADDGSGVDPELAPRLFERFVSNSAATEGRRHNGIGLALVSETVTGHGGTVELAERGRPGATFRITLPAARW